MSRTPQLDRAATNLRRSCYRRLAIEPLEHRHMLASYTVNSPGDDADEDPGQNGCDTGRLLATGEPECTLRAALQEAQRSPGPNRVEFSIPGPGPHRIQPAESLPPVTRPILIDGYTQPDARHNDDAFASNAQIRIELDGSKLAGLEPNCDGRESTPLVAGLHLLGGNATIRGLTINRFLRAGILIRGGSNNTIEGNYLGTDITGTIAMGRQSAGIEIMDSANNVHIGGTGSAGRNVVSGNTCFGVVVSNSASIGNRIQGNLIGTSAQGTAAVGNGRHGVLISKQLNRSDASASRTIVGGTEPAARNVVSGNGTDGIQIWGAAFNMVQGNFIGTTVDGSQPLANLGNGVRLVLPTAVGNVVGGSEPGAGNVISGNARSGIEISGGPSGNFVQGNRIGTDWLGAQAVANAQGEQGRAGVLIENSPGNLIGGSAAQARNQISGNKRAGIEIYGREARHNRVQGNFIGTGFLGVSPLENEGPGLLMLDVENNVVGGASHGMGNLISGNGGHGIWVVGGGKNELAGNLVGTDFTGTLAVGNAESGIAIEDSTLNEIGDPAAPRNVISGNDDHGVLLFGPKSVFNFVQHNHIGTDATATIGVGNKRSGVHVTQGATGNLIGGAGAAGNVIADNGDGVVVRNPESRHNEIAGNYIGTGGTGAAPLGNARHGVFILEASATVVGRSLGAAPNVISANGGDGVRIESVATCDGAATVAGNLIGTDVTGLVPMGNDGNGVAIVESTCNQIGLGGPDDPLARNIISDNGNHGVLILGIGATRNQVQNNYVGTNINGSAPVGNRLSGIHLAQGASANVIGGARESRNVISGNTFGVSARGKATDFNKVQGNYIGTDSTGTLPLGNAEHGVFLFDAGQTVVGIDFLNNAAGTLSREGDGNVISANHGDGILVQNLESTASQAIMGNHVGVDASGARELGNAGNGITLENTRQTEIGTSRSPFSTNVISGNRRHGIMILGPQAFENRVENNLIGTNFNGTIPIGNRVSGVHLTQGAFGNSIGGSLDAARNVISGNRFGVSLRHASTLDNRIQGNYIGTDVVGASGIGNSEHGVFVLEAGATRIGVDEDGTGGRANVISGNGGDGVRIEENSPQWPNYVFGNLIGTDHEGHAGLGLVNENGVAIVNGSNNQIGSTQSTGGNVISNNAKSGIAIRGSKSQGNRVWNNRIGLAGDDSALGNAFHGIWIEEADRNRIGGSDEDDGELDGLIKVSNIIAHNGSALNRRGHGVVVASGSGNTIRGNSIYSNAGRGIDLGNDSFTMNDGPATPGGVPDRDAGANNLQNYPLPMIVAFDGPNKTIGFVLLSTPEMTFVVEIFSNTELDPSGFGEGETLLKTDEIGTDATGFASFTYTTLKLHEHLSVTVTDEDGNTSEFSMVDADADGAADVWETPGQGMDVDEDGKVDLDLGARGASPNRKDVFVEIDAMTGFAPNPATIEWIRTGRPGHTNEGFLRAPAAAVQNPDGAEGVNLILELDELTIPHEPWTSDLDGDGVDGLGEDRNANARLDPGEDANGNMMLDAGDPRDQDGWRFFDRVKNARFGSPLERLDDARLAAKRLVYRYAVFADRVALPIPGGGATVGLSGAAEFVGNDLFVTLGAWTTPGGTAEEQAGTLMHELGHTLGLRHGGADQILFKPNYYSVMNYTWQVPRGYSWKLDYSRETLPPLNENALSEADGLGGSPSVTVPIGPITDADGITIPEQIVPQGGPVDFDLNGDLSDVVSGDLNHIVSLHAGPSPGEVLHGYDDWRSLVYRFQQSVHAVDGLREAAVSQELSLEVHQALASLGTGPGQIQFARPTFHAGEGAILAEIRLVRVSGRAGAVTIDYSTVDESATAGADYDATSGTLTLADREYTKTFVVPIVADDQAESLESLRLVLRNPGGGATLGTIDTAELTIVDDDGPGRFEFHTGFYQVDEGAGQAAVIVQRNGGTRGEASVHYATSEGSAAANIDYTAVTGTLMFGDGERRKVIVVPIHDDREVEGSESFEVALSDSTGGAGIGPLHRATVTVVERESGVVGFEAASVEIDEDRRAVVLTVQRTSGLDGDVSVNYFTADGTALAGEDYVAVAGWIDFAAGQRRKSVTIPLLDDNLIEEPESFQVNLSQPTGGAELGTNAVATIIIRSEDLGGSIRFADFDVRVREHDSLATLRVVRDQSGGTARVDFATADRTAGAGQDYTPVSGTIVFQPGETEGSFTVPILDDPALEDDESFFVALSGANGAAMGRLNRIVVTIADNEGQIEFSEPVFSASEDQPNAAVRVVRRGSTASAASVKYATSGGSATANLDYSPVSGTLSFPAGVTERTISILVHDDYLDEGTETIQLALSDPSGNAELGDLATATLRLLDVENPGSFEFAVASHVVAESAPSIEITVLRTGGDSGAVAVDYATAGGTATPGTDYVAAAGTLQFEQGESVKTFELALVDDDQAEGDETFGIVLRSPAGGAQLGDPASTVVRLLDTEGSGVFQFAETSYEVNEADERVSVVVVRGGNPSGLATVRLAAADGTARQWQDFAGFDEVLEFADGETARTVEVPLMNDARAENALEFELRLTEPTAPAELGPRVSAAVIIHDDETPLAQTYVVTNTANSGPGSLRQAILDANSHPGTDFVVFNIPGDGVHTITPTSTLPAIRDPVTMDGYSQPGASPNTLAAGSDAVLLVELGGTLGMLSIESRHTIVRGLIAGRLSLIRAAESVVEGNHGAAVWLTDTVDSRIGGRAAAARNVLTDVRINVSRSDLDISCNHGAVGPLATCNVVEGNYIGVAADGVTPLTPSTGSGVLIGGTSSNTIGGSEPGAGNLIAHHRDNGVLVADIPKFNDAGRVISYTGGKGNTIRGNRIHSNGASSPDKLGINLVDQDFNTIAGLVSGHTAPIDLAGGFPVLHGAISEEGQLAVTGRIHSTRGGIFEVDFYASASMGFHGFSQAEQYVGSATVLHNPAAAQTFSITLPHTVPDAYFLTATFSDAGGRTSEFSPRIMVGHVIDRDRFVVTTREDTDDGVCDAAHCSLREALHAANHHPGYDTIDFDIPGAGVQTIDITSSLPPTLEPLTIDGFSQPGSRPNTRDVGNDAVVLIEIRRSGSATRALTVAGGGSLIRGLAITNFRASSSSRGLVVVQRDGNRIEGNWIGVFPGRAGQESNVDFAGSANNIFGGQSPAARNVVNGQMVIERAARNTIAGNYFGTDVTGTVHAANTQIRLFRSSSNLVGGSTLGSRNIISGKVTITGDQFVILPDGRAAAAADEPGIPSRFNRVLGNWIGVSATGAPLEGSVTLLGGALFNAIGGIGPFEGNIIAGSDGHGVEVIQNDITRQSPFGNSIRGNSFRLNKRLAINLRGVTYRTFADQLYVDSYLKSGEVEVNDNLDGDGGPNEGQNYPVLHEALPTEFGLSLKGRLHSSALGTFHVDFYSSAVMDPTGFGEAETYLGSAVVLTDAAGNGTFAASLPVDVAPGHAITATATDLAGNTSEFSARLIVGDQLASPFVVNSVLNGDDGVCDASHCSLREAIHAANNHPGHDVISFHIPGPGIQTIPIGSPEMPEIDDAVTIDGYTQPGARPNALADGNDAILLVHLDGGGQSVGLNLRGGDSVIRGLVISGAASGGIVIGENGRNRVEGNFFGTDAGGDQAAEGAGVRLYASSHNMIGGPDPAARNIFGNGIFNSDALRIQGRCRNGSEDPLADHFVAEGNVVQGNYFGTNRDGTVPLGNGSQILVQCARGNLIGGPGPGERNLLSSITVGGYTVGVSANSTIPSNNRLEGNYIGIDRTGRTALGHSSGVKVMGTANVVGGPTSRHRNIIAGSAAWGVHLLGSDHRIEGNYIGTDATGTLDVGNRRDGIYIEGGIEAGWRNVVVDNVISANGGHGILLQGKRRVVSGATVYTPTTQNIIQRNAIGTTANRQGTLGNGGHGVLISFAATENSIGGPTPGEGNVIAFNGGDGVAIDRISLPGLPAGTVNRNSILSNVIHSNVELAIDLNNDGVTANDARDTDFGPNDLLNYPDLSSASVVGPSTVIEGMLVSRANQNYVMQLFLTQHPDDSGHGEARALLTTMRVTTGSDGLAPVHVEFPVPLPVGQFISAAVTDSSGNTSELSQAVEVTLAADHGEESGHLNQSRAMFLPPPTLVACAWRNPRNPFDVNADNLVTPLDALIPTNYINAHPGDPSLPVGGPPPYLDTTCDDQISPIDVLVVINILNADRSGPTIDARLFQDTGLPDGVTSDPTIVGTVTDVTGVARLTASLDGATAVRVPLDADGRFVYVPPLARDGSDDGPHTVRLLAEDARGNRSSFDVVFTFETGGPEGESSQANDLFRSRGNRNQTPLDEWLEVLEHVFAAGFDG